jgi:hypothetical protein
MAHEEAEIVRQHLSFKERDHVLLMAHEEAEIVRQHLSFKERDHVLADGTRRGGNREAALVLQRTRPRTT